MLTAKILKKIEFIINNDRPEEIGSTEGKIVSEDSCCEPIRKTEME